MSLSLLPTELKECILYETATFPHSTYPSQQTASVIYPLRRLSLLALASTNRAFRALYLAHKENLQRKLLESVFTCEPGQYKARREGCYRWPLATALLIRLSVIQFWGDDYRVSGPVAAVVMDKIASLTIPEIIERLESDASLRKAVAQMFDLIPKEYYFNEPNVWDSPEALYLRTIRGIVSGALWKIMDWMGSNPETEPFHLSLGNLLGLSIIPNRKNHVVFHSSRARAPHPWTPLLQSSTVDFYRHAETSLWKYVRERWSLYFGPDFQRGGEVKDSFLDALPAGLMLYHAVFGVEKRSREERMLEQRADEFAEEFIARMEKKEKVERELSESIKVTKSSFR